MAGKSYYIYFCELTKMFVVTDDDLRPGPDTYGPFGKRQADRKAAQLNSNKNN